jgi:prepilin-type processing-associated H-X9-DG protein
MRRDTRRSGFGFIEILIIVTIGCVLLLIILPVFSTVRKKTRRTTCLSNLRQVGMALQLYAQDYDEFMPPWANCRRGEDGKSTPWDSPENMYQSVYRKAKDPRILFCPTDIYAHRDIDVFGVNHKYSSYYFHMQPPGSPEGILTVTGLTGGGAIAVGPASYPLVRDSNLGHKEMLDGTQADGCQHANTVNIIYLDFHVETKVVKDGRIAS